MSIEVAPFEVGDLIHCPLNPESGVDERWARCRVLGWKDPWHLTVEIAEHDWSEIWDWDPVHEHEEWVVWVKDCVLYHDYEEFTI